MPRVTILAERDLRRLVPLDLNAVERVETAFSALAAGVVTMPPILRLDIPEFRGEVDVKTAYVPGLDGFVIKISPGFFDNPKIGLPSTNGMMVLLDARTGLIQALLLDNGYLTNVRTAAAGAVAARYLARPEAQVAAVLGAGVQARLQLQALLLVRPITIARIWARNHSQAETLACELREELGIDVRAERDAEAAVRDVDVIVTTTPASEPILFSSWLCQGQHVTAMGSDAEHKNELDPAVLMRADLYVADSLSQVRRLGELHHAINAGSVGDKTSLAEIGAVISGRASGRVSPSQITVCDLTGTGAQDTAIGTLAWARAAESRLGTVVEN